jgi:hypothetical protein
VAPQLIGVTALFLFFSLPLYQWRLRFLQLFQREELREGLAKAREIEVCREVALQLIVVTHNSSSPSPSLSTSGASASYSYSRERSCGRVSPRPGRSKFVEK